MGGCFNFLLYFIKHGPNPKLSVLVIVNKTLYFKINYQSSPKSTSYGEGGEKNENKILKTLEKSPLC